MQAVPIASWTAALIVAPFIGSFLGVLIRRLPDGRPLLLTRSACEDCGTRLAAWDLVPFASVLVLRRRCRTCRAPIAWFYPLVEAAALLVAVTAVWFDPARLWAGCVLGWTLLALGWIDWERFVLPDALTLPLVVAGLVASWLQDRSTIVDHALAAIVAYAALWLLNALYRRLRGRDGMGAGDAKLLAACGAWVGLAGLGPVLFLAAVAGSVLAVARHLAGETLSRTTMLPFGSCLALAAWAVWLSG